MAGASCAATCGGAKAEIAARHDAVVATRLSTVLANAAGAEVATVEHLLAALAGLGIDNVRIELDGPEVPILDGSAREWVACLDAAGRVAQPAPRRRLLLRRPVRIGLGDAWAILLPAAAPRYSVSIEFPDPAIGRQSLDFELDPERFRREIAPARTFGFLRDLDRLKAEGRARGGSLANAVVVDGERVLNPEGLRFPDEFVRHKLLDLIGDLALAGAPIAAHVIAHRPGHALNHRILRHAVRGGAARRGRRRRRTGRARLPGAARGVAAAPLPSPA
ncbi:MAG: UDP-3-O-acyl-N-acetylglucosamine deacetylase [Xanthomonadales bacterium]|nr:UDP-3-O-acyl-N-acetylglucosamine deacetylase [Xanthomonadales bacterium]